MSEAKKQHYIAQSHLSRFSSDKDGCLSLYDKFTGKVTPPTSVGNLAAENYIYNLPGPTETVLENPMFSTLEGKVGAVIEKIERNEPLTCGLDPQRDIHSETTRTSYYCSWI